MKTTKPWIRVSKKSRRLQEGRRGVNVRDKTCSKTRDTGKNKNAASLGITLPLESGQLESWYFHLGASNGISVFRSLEVAMGIFTGLTSSADERRTERSEGAPIPTICCGACAARLFGASSAVCSRRRREHARDVVAEACLAACW